MNWRQLLLFALLVLFSCNKYKISKSDLEWQPYEKGDVLIFESNKGEKDTIVVKSIDSYNNTDDPLALFPDKTEILFVMSQKNRSLLFMKAYSGGTYFRFEIRLGNNDLRYASTVLYVEELANNDEGCIKFEAIENYDNMKDIPSDLKSITWSKELGYLALEFKGDYIWTLKSFVREGKELL